LIAVSTKLTGVQTENHSTKQCWYKAVISPDSPSCSLVEITYYFIKIFAFVHLFGILTFLSKFPQINVISTRPTRISNLNPNPKEKLLNY